MPEQKDRGGIVHEHVAFGEKLSQLDHRLGAGLHRSNMLTEHVQEVGGVSKAQKARSAVRPSMPAQPQKSSIVHERVAIGGKSSKPERRSGAASHRSNMLTESAHDLLDVSRVQRARTAVRPRQDLNSDPRSKED